MRIAQICTNVMSGSVGSIVRNLCKEIESNGDEYLICYGRGKDPIEFNNYKFDTKLDVYYHVFLARLFDSDGLHSKHATRRLIKRLKMFNPDVVHIHCLHGYYINYPILFDYFENSRVKVVWTMHDCWAFTGHCCYYDFNKCNKWMKECNKCKYMKAYPKSIIISRSKRNYLMKKKIFNLIEKMTIVTPSKWLKEELGKSFLNDKQIVVINNGIDTSVFYRNDKILKQKIILGVASIWDERKGLNDFIQLSRVLPDNYKIRIIGASKKQVEELSLYDIEVIERTNNVEELVYEYNRALVLFNPTYEDNYPTVNLEANACGLPVITYNTGGSGECLINEKFGYIINVKDYTTFISLIEKIDIYGKLNENTKVLSKKKMIEQYKKIYKMR